MRSIGIDIGSSSIKIAIIDTKSNKNVITQLIEHKLKIEPGYDHQIDIIDFLRTLSSEQSSYQPRYCMTVSQEKVSTKQKLFPFKERQKIIKSLAFELEDELPLTVDKAIFDSKILCYINQQAKVLAVACPKTHISDLISLCNDALIDPHIFSPEGFCFLNVISSWSRPPLTLSTNEEIDDIDQKQTSSFPEKAKIYLNLGYKRVVAVVVTEDDQIVATRSFLWGSQRLVESIAQNYKLSYQEAYKETISKSFILVNKDGATKDQINFSNIISNSIKPFIREMQLWLIEIKSSFHLDFSELLYTGGTAQVKNLGAYFTQNLNLPSNHLRYVDKIDSVVHNGLSDKQVICFATAIGAAIETLKIPRNPAINFLKNEFASRNKGIKVIWKQFGPSLIALFFLFFIFSIYGLSRDSVSKTLSDQAYQQLQEQAGLIANLPKSKITPSQINKFIQERQYIADTQKLLLSAIEINSPLEIIKQISQFLPTKNETTLDIIDLNIQNNQLRISGFTNSTPSIAKIKSALSKIAKNGMITQKKAPQNATNQRLKHPFSFEMSIDRNTGGID